MCCSFASTICPLSTSCHPRHPRQGVSWSPGLVLFVVLSRERVAWHGPFWSRTTANTLLCSASASISPVMISRLARSVGGRPLTKAPSMQMIIRSAGFQVFDSRQFPSVSVCRCGSPTRWTRLRVVVWVVPPVGGRNVWSRAAALRYEICAPGSPADDATRASLVPERTSEIGLQTCVSQPH